MISVDELFVVLRFGFIRNNMDNMLDFSGCTILIVDDITTNIDILINGLENESYDIAVAVDGPSALEIIPNIKPDLIMLDIMMPGMSGYEVCKILKDNPETSKIPVIFLTALDQIKNKTEGFEIGAVDYVTKPFDIMEVRSRINTHLELSLSQKLLKKQNEILDQRVKERTLALARANSKLEDLQVEIIMRLGLATEMRDDDTGAHVRKICNIVEFLAGKCGLEEEVCKVWGLASTMHDVGKVGIPDNILLKPGRLTAEEFDVIKTHTIIGAKILEGSESELIQVARIIALNHHEKWDGSGYPAGLVREDIPLAARITAIADVFDALISARPYKDPWPLEKIIELFNNESGKHFDPELTAMFMEAVPEIMQMRQQLVN